jgi:ornithine cyclodeaminase/alanine dehydrogenase-like protein (mu-crystallin family)
MATPDLLYLSSGDVEGLGITANDVNEAIDRAFRLKGEGRTWTRPELSIHLSGGRTYYAKAAVMTGFGACKWHAHIPGNEQYGLADLNPLVILNEGVTGLAVAIMDARWISGVRTASLTALAARYLAKTEPISVGFIACGRQARAHLAALHAQFPIARVSCHSRKTATAERFAAEARAQGFAAEVVEPRAVVEGSDIVVSSTPLDVQMVPFLDADWVKPGGFVAAIDLGYSWRRESLESLDRVVTDDMEQNGPGGPVALNCNPARYDADLGELAAGLKPGRTSSHERNAFISSGFGLGDLAAAVLVYEHARAKGMGRVLPR